MTALPKPPPVLPWIVAFAAVGACGPTSRRDLGSIPQRQITYDDMCHLQDYFDQRAASHAQPFHAQNEQSTETSREERDEHGQLRRVVLGEGTYEVTDHTDRTRLVRVLHEEYRRMPEGLHITRPETQVRVHVGWWQSGTIRRLRPDMDVDLQVNDTSVTLPFNPCVGEFLFGNEAYAMRRNVLGAESARAHGEIPPQYLPDGGPAPDADADAGSTASTPATPDGGAMDAATATVTDASMDASMDGSMDASADASTEDGALVPTDVHVPSHNAARHPGRQVR